MHICPFALCIQNVDKIKAVKTRGRTPVFKDKTCLLNIEKQETKSPAKYSGCKLWVVTKGSQCWERLPCSEVGAKRVIGTKFRQWKTSPTLHTKLCNRKVVRTFGYRNCKNPSSTKEIIVESNQVFSWKNSIWKNAFKRFQIYHHNCTSDQFHGRIHIQVVPWSFLFNN